MPSLAGALITVDDYVEAAYAASPKVKHVRVRAVVNDPKMKPGVVEIRARGRFWRRLSDADARRVHLAIVARNPVNVAIEMK